MRKFISEEKGKNRDFIIFNNVGLFMRNGVNLYILDFLLCSIIFLDGKFGGMEFYFLRF